MHSSPAFSTVLLYGGIALLGLLAAIGVNALADRVAGDEEPPLRGDQCATCRVALSAGRWLPLAEWWAFHGRCPNCGARLTLRRAGVQVALALAFPLLLAHATGPGMRVRIAPAPLFILDALVLAALALTFVIDVEHHLILDVVTYPTAAVLVLAALLLDRKALAAMAVGVVIAGGLFLAFYWLGRLLYHEEALGLGDVKLAALVGIAVGWPGIISALFLAALFGAAISMALLGLGRVSARTYIPFGTFLSVGGAVALLLAVPVWA
ncbi:MAG TPA: A24 family peptidase [Ktedonobacterales bacterium]|nr:A24 family peptidase [Ktedonobacterales bacterium]